MPSVAEYNALVPYMEEHDLSFEGPLSRKEELLSEMNIRLTRYDYYEDYKRCIWRSGSRRNKE